MIDRLAAPHSDEALARGADLLLQEQRGREAVHAIADDHIHHIAVDAVGHARTEGAPHGPHLHDA